MKLKRFAASLVLTLSLFSQSAIASLGPASQQINAPVVVLKLSDLRSAYLIRAGVVYYDERGSVGG